MNWLYLLALLGSSAGMAALDVRYRLVLWAAPVRSACLVFAGALLLLVADFWAIERNVFARGESAYLSVIWLAPHMPLEEPVFLLFLCYCTLVVFALCQHFGDVLHRKFLAPLERS